MCEICQEAIAKPRREEMKAVYRNEAAKGEKRVIRVGQNFVEVVCAMMLGMQFEPDSGKMYRECIWHRLDNGRSIHGSAHEDWI